jgi:hypothetical protein
MGRACLYGAPFKFNQGSDHAAPNSNNSLSPFDSCAAVINRACTIPEALAY